MSVVRRMGVLEGNPWSCNSRRRREEKKGSSLVGVVVVTLVVLVVARNHPRANAFVLSKREGRYFTVEKSVPFLPQIMPTNSEYSKTLPYSKRLKSLPVTYTNDPKVVQQWLIKKIPADGPCILGFDVESVPGHYDLDGRFVKFKGPATIQLATLEACLVVHLVRPNGRPSMACAPILNSVLMDESIVKCGCAIDDDMLALSPLQIEGIRSRFDLGLLNHQARGKKTQCRVGLKRLTELVLNLNLDKDNHVARSNWSRVPLKPCQIEYSALDAWAGAAIVTQLGIQDPRTFAPDVLTKRLRKDEHMVKELRKRLKTRKAAKKRLSVFVRRYRGQNMPQNVAKHVWELECIVKNNEIKQPDWDLSKVEQLGLLLDR